MKKLILFLWFSLILVSNSFALSRVSSDADYLFPTIQEDVDDDTPHFNTIGFISQSIVKTSNGTHISGNSDSRFGSVHRNEIGLASSLFVNENIEVRGMGIYQVDGARKDYHINYFLVDIHQSNADLGVRIGKFSFGYGFYNEARNNPAYSDMEFPPQSMYADSINHVLRSGVGTQLYYGVSFGDYIFDIDLGIGKPELYKQKEISHVLVDDSNLANFKKTSYITSINTSLQNTDIGYSINYSRSYLNFDMTTQSIQTPFQITTIADYLGFRKDFKYGELTLEYMVPKQKDSAISANTTDYKWGGAQAYAITYKQYLSMSWSATIGYDSYYKNKDDKFGKEAALYYPNTPPAQFYHRSYNIGVKYRSLDYVLKLEHHIVDGTLKLQSEGNNLSSFDQPKKYSLTVATFVYMFR